MLSNQIQPENKNRDVADQMDQVITTQPPPNSLDLEEKYNASLPSWLKNGQAFNIERQNKSNPEIMTPLTLFCNSHNQSKKADKFQVSLASSTSESETRRVLANVEYLKSYKIPCTLCCHCLLCNLNAGLDWDKIDYLDSTKLILTSNEKERLTEGNSQETPLFAGEMHADKKAISEMKADAYEDDKNSSQIGQNEVYNVTLNNQSRGVVKIEAIDPHMMYLSDEVVVYNRRYIYESGQGTVKYIIKAENKQPWNLVQSHILKNREENPRAVFKIYKSGKEATTENQQSETSFNCLSSVSKSNDYMSFISFTALDGNPIGQFEMNFTKAEPFSFPYCPNFRGFEHNQNKPHKLFIEKDISEEDKSVLIMLLCNLENYFQSQAYYCCIFCCSAYNEIQKEGFDDDDRNEDDDSDDYEDYDESDNDN